MNQINPPYFVNITNHPSSNWSDIQRNEAERMGSIIDIPFPDVDPNLLDVNDLCEQILQKVDVCTGGNTNSVIHVMGEMTLCFRLIRRLQILGYRCLASTTRRITTEENGVKISKFQFVRFRDY